MPLKIRPFFGQEFLFSIVIDPKAIQVGHFRERNAPFADKVLNHKM